jgi:ribose transport system substrate-binding protein
MSSKGLLIALAVCALLASGCGGGSSGGGGGAKQYHLTFIQGVKGDEFYITMNCGVQEAAKRLGATVDVQGPDQFDATLQTPIVNAVIAKRPDAVLIAPNDAKAMIAPLTQMKQAGIKIVLVDTTLERHDIAVSEIASDNLQGGQAAADALAKLIGSAGDVMVVNVKPGISTTDQRAQGFAEEIKKTPGLKYLGVQYDDDQPAKAQAIVTSTLAAHRDLVGIFAANLYSGEGSATGLQQSGRKDVKIVEFDASPKQVEDLRNGVVQALVSQKPYDIGKDGVEQALAALQGKPTQKQIGTDFAVITKDNLASNQDALYKSSC